MTSRLQPIAGLYILQALVKGFSVFYFVLLPVFYAQQLITTTEIGYIGALFIVLLIFGAIIVARWLHNLETKKLLQISSYISIGASFLLLVGALQRDLSLITLSYCFMGLSVGTAMSGVNVVAANVTTRGNRYSSLARLGMLTDIVRIVFPLLVSGAVVLGAMSGAIILIILSTFIFLIVTMQLPQLATSPKVLDDDQGKTIRKNKHFLYILSLEFLDSFSSSQLFVFLPLLFLAKGYSLEGSLVLQSCIFLGYLSGRILVSYLAKRFTGIAAVAYAEIGMVCCIIFLLLVNTMWVLYLLSFALGIFARGTSPAIKALAFDSLAEHQMKKGSALHVVAGDSGSALGQFIFGILIAFYGVNSPFIVSGIVAIVIMLACFLHPKYFPAK